MVGTAQSNGKVEIIRGSLTVHEVCGESMLGLRAAARKRATDKIRRDALTLGAMNRWGGRSLVSCGSTNECLNSYSVLTLWMMVVDRGGMLVSRVPPYVLAPS